MSKTSGKTSTHASILDRINPAAMAWINAGGSADSFYYYRTEIEARINEINAEAHGRAFARTVKPFVGGDGMS